MCINKPYTVFHQFSVLGSICPHHRRSVGPAGAPRVSRALAALSWVTVSISHNRAPAIGPHLRPSCFAPITSIPLYLPGCRLSSLPFVLIFSNFFPPPPLLFRSFFYFLTTIISLMYFSCFIPPFEAFLLDRGSFFSIICKSLLVELWLSTAVDKIDFFNEFPPFMFCWGPVINT